MEIKNYGDSEELVRRLLPNTSGENVAAASEKLNLPKLLSIHSANRTRLALDKENLRKIEEHPDFKRAEYLINPKFGELTRKMAEKKSSLLAISEKLKAFRRHDDFNRLRSGTIIGRTVSVGLALGGFIFIAMGLLADRSGAEDATLILGFIGSISLAAAALCPVLMKMSLEYATSKELGFRSYRQALSAFEKLNMSLALIGEEMTSLRSKELAVQGLVERHFRLSQEIRRKKESWLTDLRNAALISLGAPPIKTTQETAEVIPFCQKIIGESEPSAMDKHEDFDLDPGANARNPNWNVYDFQTNEKRNLG